MYKNNDTNIKLYNISIYLFNNDVKSRSLARHMQDWKVSINQVLLSKTPEQLHYLVQSYNVQ